MRIDKFTKTVLTIIAVNLSVLTLVNLDIIPGTIANEPGQNQNMNYGLIPINEDGSITVTLSSTEEIDVNITDISTSDELKVDISDISTYKNFEVELVDINTTDQLNVNLKSVDSWAFQYVEVPVKVKSE